MKGIFQATVVIFSMFFIHTISFSTDFHVLISSEQQGPYSPQQLQKMTTEGSITQDTMVWKSGMSEWEKAGAQQELQTLWTAPSSAMPPPPPPVTAKAVPPAVPSNVSSSQEQPIDAELITTVQEDPDQGSHKKVNAAIEEWRITKGIEFGTENAKGQIFYMATEQVPVDATNPQWPKWRVVAYDKAYAKIKKEFSKEMYGKQKGEDLEEIFADDSDDRLEFSKTGDSRAFTKEGEIWDKMKALTGAKLDKALKEYDIDPSEYNAAPPEQRKRLFTNNFVKKTITKAAGQLNGLITIKTFEGVDKKGNHTIGVVAMYYDKLKQLADDIVKRQEPMLKKKSGNPVHSYIPKDKKKLTESFGTRLVFDENGRPAIVSYGQWSYMYKGKNDRKRARGYDFAMEKASTEAERNIVKFLNSKATYQKIDTTNAEEIEEAVMDRDGNVSEPDVMTMIDKMESTLEVKFEGELRGIRTAKKYSYEHENGHEIIGVVKIWTQDNALAADKIRNWKPKSKTPSEGSIDKLHVQNNQAGVREGVGMELDF